MFYQTLAPDVRGPEHRPFPVWQSDDENICRLLNNTRFGMCRDDEISEMKSSEMCIFVDLQMTSSGMCIFLNLGMTSSERCRFGIQ